MIEAIRHAMNRGKGAAAERPGDHARDESDRRLVERIAAGEESVMLELFDRHHHRLHLYCLSMVGDREAAADLAQEQWLRLIAFIRSGAEIRSPVGLMLTIARNLCLNHLRLTRPHLSLEDLPESDHPVAHSRELSHLEELVVLSLPRLPFAQREVLTLHAYCGYRFEEIAEMLGEPAGVVRMRASRARSALGRIISAILAIEEDQENARRKEGGSMKDEER